MKNKGGILLEYIFAITLFILVVFPIFKFNGELIKINNRILNIENNIKNIKAIEKQLSGKGAPNLIEFIGVHKYKIKNNEINRDELTKNIIFLKNLEDDDEMEIEIFPVYFSINGENYEYIELKIKLKTKIKILEFKEIIREKNEF